MSGLLNGADCSVNSNPLNNVLKREGVDNSVFRVGVTFSFQPDLEHRPNLGKQWNAGHATSRGGPVTS